MHVHVLNMESSVTSTYMRPAGMAQYCRSKVSFLCRIIYAVTKAEN